MTATETAVQHKELWNKARGAEPLTPAKEMYPEPSSERANEGEDTNSKTGVWQSDHQGGRRGIQ